MRVRTQIACVPFCLLLGIFHTIQARFSSPHLTVPSFHLPHSVTVALRIGFQKQFPEISPLLFIYRAIPLHGAFVPEGDWTTTPYPWHWPLSDSPVEALVGSVRINNRPGSRDVVSFISDFTIHLFVPSEGTEDAENKNKEKRSGTNELSDPL